VDRSRGVDGTLYTQCVEEVHSLALYRSTQGNLGHGCARCEDGLRVNVIIHHGYYGWIADVISARLSHFSVDPSCGHVRSRIERKDN